MTRVSRPIWPVRALAALAALSAAGAAVDVSLEGQWAGPPVEVAARVLTEPDRDLRAYAQAHRSEAASRAAAAVRPLGNRYVATFLVLAFGLAGWLGRRPRALAFAVNVLLASALSAALGVGIQVASGRSRPAAGLGAADFQGPTRDRLHRSFPSGHATQAFALATVVSDAARQPAVTAAAYGVASLVALSRVYDDRHFYSDILAGALLGSATAWWVLRWRGRRA